MAKLRIDQMPGHEDVERFRAEVERLLPPTDPLGSLPVGLAVSGGPDSLALLLLAAAAFPDEIEVASVDHGLRPEAAEEVALVKSICEALEVPFTSLRVRVAGGNLQARAREARYEALAQWARRSSVGSVATAHHADDQAETLLMRLARGSGLSGLAGVREATILCTQDGSDPHSLIRPLLRWRKSELEEIVAASGIEPVRDPSNEEVRFDRVRVRQHLAEHDWLDPTALSTSAQHLSEAWNAIGWYAQEDWEERVSKDPVGGGYVYYANVPRIIQIETVKRIIEELGGVVTRAEADRAAERLWNGQNASLGGVLAVPEDGDVEIIFNEKRIWRFTLEPPRRTH